MLHLAHLSDLHISPLAWPSFREFFSKRWVGFFSWHLRRRFIHRADMVEKLIETVHALSPDHIACTGDLLNLASRREFLEGKKWLEHLGLPEEVSFVPGNHDAYALCPDQFGEDLWGAYTSGNLALPPLVPGKFPYVRQIKNIALIGLSTACPQPIGSARGALGESQRAALEKILTFLRQNGFYRVVLIHHPPLLSLQKKGRELKDAAECEAILKRSGAELILCGHGHQNILQWLETSTGRACVSMVSSASSVCLRSPASFGLFGITRKGGEWVTEIRRYSYFQKSRDFKERYFGHV